MPYVQLRGSISLQGWAWEMQGSITAGMNLAIMKQKEGGKSVYAGVLEPFARAIDIALGD